MGRSFAVLMLIATITLMLIATVLCLGACATGAGAGGTGATTSTAPSTASSTASSTGTGTLSEAATMCAKARADYNNCTARAVDLENCARYRQTANNPKCSAACGTGCEHGTIWVDCQYALEQLASAKCTDPPPDWNKCALTFQTVVRCTANSGH